MDWTKTLQQVTLAPNLTKIKGTQNVALNIPDFHVIQQENTLLFTKGQPGTVTLTVRLKLDESNIVQIDGIDGNGTYEIDMLTKKSQVKLFTHALTRLQNFGKQKIDINTFEF